jgi:histone H3/H4
LITIYDKSEDASIPKPVLQKLVKSIFKWQQKWIKIGGWLKVSPL